MKKSSLTRRVVEYLLTLDVSDFASLDVNSTARQFEVNRSYLSTRFKRDTGIALQEYIHIMKIVRSISILEAAVDVHIEELSRIMGFARTNYFISIFKRMMQTSPNKYREYFRKAKPLKMLFRLTRFSGKVSE